MSEQRAKITKRVVDASYPRDGERYCVWDTEIKGFRLRILPSGRKVYELRYRVGARQRLVTIGTHGSPWTAEAARQKAWELLVGLTSGHDPQAAKEKAREALTVSELVRLYLDQGPADKPAKRASSWATDRYNLERHAEPELGNKIARDLTTADLSQWQAAVTAGKTAQKSKSEKKRGTINVRGGRGAAARAMRALAAMLAWAVSRGILDQNVSEEVTKLKDGRRERYLSDAEAARIWTAVEALEKAESGGITKDQADAFKLLMQTGARRGEILGLRWTEVDLNRRILILPPARHKSGSTSRPKSITLTGDAVAVLQARDRIGTYVFGREDLDAAMPVPKRAWARVLAHAKVTDASFHVLRHTLASFAIADGKSLYLVGKALGHAKAETTQRYAHLRDDATAQAVEGAASRYTRKSAAPKPSRRRRANADR